MHDMDDFHVYYYIIHQITPSLHYRPLSQLVNLQFHNSQKTVVHSGLGLAPRIIVNTFIYIFRILNKKQTLMHSLTVKEILQRQNV